MLVVIGFLDFEISLVGRAYSNGRGYHVPLEIFTESVLVTALAGCHLQQIARMELPRPLMEPCCFFFLEKVHYFEILSRRVELLTTWLR